MKRLKHIKNNLRRATALLLATALTVCGLYTQPVSATAIENTEEFVSDVMLYQGTLADAQSEYPEYTFVGQGLTQNANHENDGRTGDMLDVYLGYQTTTDASKAIRDIACMQMLGNYNTSDYDEVLKEQKDHLKEVIAQLKTTIEEFRDNYEAGQQRALDAYDLLNKYYEEDTGLKMADFFLDTSGTVTEENYVTLFLEANSSTVNALESILASATDAGNTLWLDRLVAMGDNDDACLYDGLMEAKMVELQGRTGKPALKYFDSLYHEDIELLNKSWESLREGLQGYIDSGINLSDDDQETIEAYEEELEKKEEGSSLRFHTYGAIYELLAHIQYGSEDAEKKSLVDLFLKYLPVEENAEIPEENLIEEPELFAILGSWTEGQRFAATTQGVDQLFSSVTKQALEDNVESEILEIDQELLEENAEDLEKIESTDGVDSIIEAMESVDEIFGEETAKDGALSVYAGVDRSFFDSKIAMTCEASRKEEATGESAFTSVEGFAGYVVEACLGFTVFAGGIVVLGMANRIGEHYFKEAYRLVEKYERKIAASNSRISDISDKLESLSEASGSKAYRKATVELKQETEELGRLMDSKRTAEAEAIKVKGSITNSMRVIGLGMMALGLYLTIRNIISAIDEYKREHEEKKVEYTEIPDKMVDQSRGEEGMGPYVYYSVVKNQEGNAMDLNHWSSEHWLALYTTKSAEGGRPILANDFGKICVGTPDSDTLGMGYIHLFGEYSAQNLVSYSKSGEDANPIYFFFNRGEEPGSQTASTFGGGDSFFLLSALMLAIGISGGFLLGTYNRKKKAIFA